jgi:hypothetical protein
MRVFLFHISLSLGLAGILAGCSPAKEGFYVFHPLSPAAVDSRPVKGTGMGLFDDRTADVLRAELQARNIKTNCYILVTYDRPSEGWETDFCIALVLDTCKRLYVARVGYGPDDEYMYGVRIYGPIANPKLHTEFTLLAEDTDAIKGLRYFERPDLIGGTFNMVAYRHGRQIERTDLRMEDNASHPANRVGRVQSVDSPQSATFKEPTEAGARPRAVQQRKSLAWFHRLMCLKETIIEEVRRSRGKQGDVLRVGHCPFPADVE